MTIFCKFKNYGCAFTQTPSRREVSRSWPIRPCPFRVRFTIGSSPKRIWPHLIRNTLVPFFNVHRKIAARAFLARPTTGVLYNRNNFYSTNKPTFPPPYLFNPNHDKNGAFEPRPNSRSSRLLEKNSARVRRHEKCSRTDESVFFNFVHVVSQRRKLSMANNPVRTPFSRPKRCRRQRCNPNVVVLSSFHTRRSVVHRCRHRFRDGKTKPGKNRQTGEIFYRITAIVFFFLNVNVK